VKASAPGKIILFGEHAVVYGRPAIAVPVTQVSAQAEVSESSRPGIWIDASDVGLHAELSTLPADRPLAALVHNLLAALGHKPYPDLQITISSTIPIASGMGSGAAVSVAVARAMASALGFPISDEQVSAFAYEIEKLHHGTPSGIDNTVVTHSRPVFFVRGRPIETLDVGAPFTIVIGDTGVPAPTKEAVSDVHKLWESDQARWDAVFDEVGKVVQSARERIATGAWMELGPLMIQNHRLLQQLTVSSPALDRLVAAALEAGALGAKLSGGGRGGNMIALAGEGTTHAIAAALKSAGSPRVIIAPVPASA